MSRCKIIINNETGIAEPMVLEMVFSVVRKGKVEYKRKDGTITKYDFAPCTNFHNAGGIAIFSVWFNRTKAGSLSFRISDSYPHKIIGGLEE